MAKKEDSPKPDFRNGFPIRDLPDGGMALGQVDREDVVLVRRGDEFFAVGAHCTHYHGPLIRRFDCWRNIAVPLASCMFQSSPRRSLARTRAGSNLCWQVERWAITCSLEQIAQPSPKFALSSRIRRVGHLGRNHRRWRELGCRG
jgi:hypothetical protein